MEDFPETNHMVQRQPETKETAGDLLRKERVTRRITLDTIAKDLKLSVSYIKAIESNSQDDLPAPPYVRVYLRSIATYLQLDPDEILKHFFEDRGLPATDAGEESQKIDVSIGRTEERTFTPWLVVAVIIIVLALLSYVSNRKGWLEPSTEEPVAPAVSPDSIEQTLDTLPESLPAADPVGEEEESEKDTTTQEIVPESAVDPPNDLHLVISAVKDSVWAQVFTDGRSWRSFIRAGKSRVFHARDSINLHVGNNPRLKYALNGRQIKINGKGVIAFRLDAGGVEPWSLAKWNRVFKDRLDL